MMNLLRRIIAFIFRTFVADCPICHKHFYGFHAYEEHLKVEGVTYRIACHRCADKMSNIVSKIEDKVK